MKLEIIGFNLASCLAAQQAGADRIELCDNYHEGGTTPCYGAIRAAREKLSIELYVMIRPRGGEFLYSAEEYAMMKDDIRLCRQLNCDGVVLGMLQADGTVDQDRCARLVEEAYPLGVTFHRAFDGTCDPFRSLEDIIGSGCERILTSGLQPTAAEGAGLISQLVERAGDRISIMPGSGVHAGNILDLAGKTGAVEFHSSARQFVAGNMVYRNPALATEKSILVDEAEVRAMRAALDSCSGIAK